MTRKRTEDETEAPVGRMPDKREVDDFGSRLKKARHEAGLDQAPPGPAPPLSLASYALRLATEMIAGVIVGGLIGWWVDRTFKTSPFGLIGFLLLGTAAGLLNVVRSVQRMNAQLGRGGTASQPPPGDDDDA